MNFTFNLLKRELAIEIKLIKCFSAVLKFQKQITPKQFRKIQHQNNPPPLKEHIFFLKRQEFVPFLQYH